MAKKVKKRRVRIGRIYDLFILLIYTILSLLTLFALRHYTTKFVILAALILGLIFLIFFLTLFLNKNIIEYIRRSILTLLSFLLFFGYSQIHSLNSFFTNLTTQEEEQYVTTQMNLLSLQSSDVFTAVVEEFNDIEGKTVGLNVTTDKNASAYVQNKLNESFDEVTFVEYSDYANMMKDLYYGYVDVICLNTTQQSTLEESWGPLEDFTMNVRSYTYKEKVEISQNEKDITKEVFTVLVSANDETGAPANYSKSDANMLFMINPNTHQIFTVSIPRDSYIANPAYGYAMDKLTHTGNNGVENTKEAVENALGLDVDFYIKVSFSSVIEIIDTLGGIEVDVPISFCEQDENRSFEAEDLICLNEGIQKLNGSQALAYARHRHSYTNQDLGRNEAQMRVIKAILKKVLTTEGISKIDDVLEIVPSYVLTNFSNAQLQSFIKSQMDDLQPWTMQSLSLAKGLTSDNVITASMPGVGTSVYYLNKQEVKTLQNAYQYMMEDHNLEDFSFELDALYESDSEFIEGVNTIYYDTTLSY